MLKVLSHRLPGLEVPLPTTQTSFCDLLHQCKTSDFWKRRGGGDRVVGLKGFENGPSGSMPTIGYTSPADKCMSGL
jgi:hypothetical protein